MGSRDQSARLLKDIGGLETNRINQLVVEPTCKPLAIQTFTLLATARHARAGRGLCSAACSGCTPDGDLRMNNILAQMNGKPLKNYQYKDMVRWYRCRTSPPLVA